MHRTSGRGRIAALLLPLLPLILVAATTPASATPPSVTCSRVGTTLDVFLQADDPTATASARIAVLDRAGRIGVEDGVASGVWLACDATVANVSLIRVTGSPVADEVWISEDGGDARPYPFPSSVAFEVALGGQDGSAPGDGDLLGLAVRRDGGSASLGATGLSLGRASGTHDGVEFAYLDLGFSRDGSGRASLDASAATIPVLLLGGPSTDVLRGGAGDDFLAGYAGSDLLDGGGGDDDVDGGAGRDRCAGESTLGCEVLL